jgi:hypothetical protein
MMAPVLRSAVLPEGHWVAGWRISPAIDNGLAGASVAVLSN